jgi:hypothetical protein
VKIRGTSKEQTGQTAAETGKLLGNLRHIRGRLPDMSDIQQLEAGF